MSTQKSGKTYYSRLRVPFDLLLVMKKIELVKSLKTSSYREAFVLSSEWEFRIVKLFNVLRKSIEKLTFLVKHLVTMEAKMLHMVAMVKLQKRRGSLRFLRS